MKLEKKKKKWFVQPYLEFQFTIKNMQNEEDFLLLIPVGKVRKSTQVLYILADLGIQKAMWIINFLLAGTVAL